MVQPSPSSLLGFLVLLGPGVAACGATPPVAEDYDEVRVDEPEEEGTFAIAP